jgi:hypothetical protein
MQQFAFVGNSEPSAQQSEEAYSCGVQLVYVGPVWGDSKNESAYDFKGIVCPEGTTSLKLRKRYKIGVFEREQCGFKIFDFREKKTMKFRKKPIVIDAYQVDQEHFIETLEGVMRAKPGDWIITGINGEKYPCDNEIFEKTYDKVEEI